LSDVYVRVPEDIIYPDKREYGDDDKYGQHVDREPDADRDDESLGESNVEVEKRNEVYAREDYE
jgi:hypothetical protein